jgi:hypothetical protein
VLNLTNYTALALFQPLQEEQSQMLYDKPPINARPQRILGRGLALRKTTASQRAAMAAQVLCSEVDFKLSKGQPAKLFATNVIYIGAAKRLSPIARKILAQGVTKSVPSFVDALVTNGRVYTTKS